MYSLNRHRWWRCLWRGIRRIVITTGSIFVMVPELIPDFSLSEETRVLIPLEPNTWFSKLFPVSAAAGLASDVGVSRKFVNDPPEISLFKVSAPVPPAASLSLRPPASAGTIVDTAEVI
jgi:hypothetical protein